MSVEDLESIARKELLRFSDLLQENINIEPDINIELPEFKKKKEKKNKKKILNQKKKTNKIREEKEICKIKKHKEFGRLKEPRNSNISEEEIERRKLKDVIKSKQTKNSKQAKEIEDLKDIGNIEDEKEREEIEDIKELNDLKNPKETKERIELKFGLNSYRKNQKKFNSKIFIFDNKKPSHLNFKIRGSKPFSSKILTLFNEDGISSLDRNPKLQKSQKKDLKILRKMRLKQIPRSRLNKDCEDKQVIPLTAKKYPSQDFKPKELIRNFSLENKQKKKKVKKKYKKNNKTKSISANNDKTKSVSVKNDNIKSTSINLSKKHSKTSKNFKQFEKSLSLHFVPKRNISTSIDNLKRASVDSKHLLKRPGLKIKTQKLDLIPKKLLNKKKSNPFKKSKSYYNLKRLSVYD